MSSGDDEANEKSLVLGTAGHIDHGKTSLVRALTGRDLDRLPEEKARGITIELGFAPLEVDEDLRLAVVDVPGHERFVRTMVAGASGLDLVMLVVAADEGGLAVVDVAGGAEDEARRPVAQEPAWRGSIRSTPM